ncbi:MAG: hypothetical protein J0H48_11090 [Nitrosospira multiformis]|nr:hypothetical protein [Nitrosospira multiformis]
MKNTLHFLAGLACALPLQVFAHGPSMHHGQPDAPRQVSATVPADAPLEPVAARYTERRIDSKTRSTHTAAWYFWRDPTRIETASPEGRIAEAWARDAHGRISHARYFHEDRRVIEATTGELKARGIEPDWQELGKILDPRDFPGMRRVGATSVLGQRASIYRGKSGSDDLEVVWLDAVRLPARITRYTKASRMILRLEEFHRENPPGWQRVDTHVTEDYQRIDLADLGDMENDPFVRKVLRTSSGQGGHQH